jgi:hypothetical protein
MSLLDKINPRRAQYQEEHTRVERRLTAQENQVRRFEIRLRRLELELGVMVPEILEEEKK